MAVDNEIDAEISIANEQEARLRRESRWEHFLFSEQKEDRVEQVLKTILGERASPDSAAWVLETRSGQDHSIWM
jgi:hypothetical protein